MRKLCICIPSPVEYLWCSLFTPSKLPVTIRAYSVHLVFYSDSVDCSPTVTAVSSFYRTRGRLSECDYYRSPCCIPVTIMHRTAFGQGSSKHMTCLAWHAVPGPQSMYCNNTSANKSLRKEFTKDTAVYLAITTILRVLAKRHCFTSRKRHDFIYNYLRYLSNVMMSV